MNDDTMRRDATRPATPPNDPFDARISRYLDWEAGQLTGAPRSAEIAAALATPGVQRGARRNPMLVWAALVVVVLGAIIAVAVVGGPRQQLVTVSSNVPAVDQSRPATAAPSTDATPRVDETSPPLANCQEVAPEGTYMATAGTLPVRLTVPATGTWAGSNVDFDLWKGTCADHGQPAFQGSLVGRVYADACRGPGTEVETPTAFHLAEALAAQTGHETVGPIETELGPYRATRLDFHYVGGASSCGGDFGAQPFVSLFGDVILLWDQTAQLYVAEVDGSSLVVTVTYYADDLTAADLAEIDAVIASLIVDI